MLSLPIPDDNSPIRYDELRWRGHDVGELVSQLTRNRKQPKDRAHLDPDLDLDMYPRDEGWRPLLGQTGSAQGHLRNQRVTLGDLFLFFGLFQEVTEKGGCWQFVRHAKKQHVIWGWMQIGEIHEIDTLNKNVLSWARYHPHFQGDRGTNNTIYVATERLNLPSASIEEAGAGVFPRIHASRVFTDPGSQKTTNWRLPISFYPCRNRRPLTYHPNLERWQRAGDDYCLLLCSGRGQEFVLDLTEYSDVTKWLHSIFRSGAQDH